MAPPFSMSAEQRIKVIRSSLADFKKIVEPLLDLEIGLILGVPNLHRRNFPWAKHNPYAHNAKGVP